MTGCPFQERMRLTHGLRPAADTSLDEEAPQDVGTKGRSPYPRTPPPLIGLNLTHKNGKGYLEKHWFGDCSFPGNPRKAKSQVHPYYIL
jgi:hypothetical protein